MDHPQKAWLPLEVHHTDPAVSQSNARRGSIRWGTFLETHHFQWFKARLHPHSSTIQPVILPSTTECFQRCRAFYMHQISSRWLCCLTSNTLQEKQTLERLITNTLFADDCAFLAHQENHLQTIINRYPKTSKVFGLTISLGKMEILL